MRSFTRGLDDELAAHDYVLLVRHGHAAPGSQQRLLDATSPRAVLRMPDYLAPCHELNDGGWNGVLAANPPETQGGQLMEYPRDDLRAGAQAPIETLASAV